MLVPREQIEQAILVIRAQRVMVDTDLAKLYGVATKALKPSGQEKQNPLPHGFHVPTDR